MSEDTVIVLAALFAWYLIGLLTMVYVKYRTKKRSKGLEQTSSIDVFGMAFMGPVLLLPMIYWRVAAVVKRYKHKRRNLRK